MSIHALWSYTSCSSVILKEYLRVWSPSALKEFSCFLEAVSLKRLVVKEQSEVLAVSPSTCAWGSDQDQKVPYLIPIWGSLWTDTMMLHLYPTLSKSSSQPDNLAFWFDLRSFSWLWTWWVFAGWTWLLPLGMIWTWLTDLVSWLHFREAAACACPVLLNSCLAFCKATCPCCFLTGPEGKELQYSLNPTICIFCLSFCSALLSPNHCPLVSDLEAAWANTYGYLCSPSFLLPTFKSLHPSCKCMSLHTNGYLISSKLKLSGWIVSGNDLGINQC